MKNMSKIMWGMVLIVIGLILAINSLGLMKINIFFPGWWTLFIIVPSLIGLINDNDKKGSLIFLIIGMSLLLMEWDVISFSLILKMIVPFILICIGLSFIWDSFKGVPVKEKIKNANMSNASNITGIFCEERRIVQGDMDDYSVDAVFGSVYLDIKDAKLKDETVLKCSAIFGGIDILAPKDVEIKMTSTNIFGGVDNRRRNEENLGKGNKKVKTIYIEAFTMFGGIDIK